MALPSPHRADELQRHEVAFLRAYSDSLLRLQAMQHSGAAYALGLDPVHDAHEIEAAAGRIVAKAERLPLDQLASCLGADKVAFLKRLWDICLSAEPHEAIKGLQLLARIHGVWDKEASRKTPNVQIVFGPPAPQRDQIVNDLPFSIDVTPTKPTP